MKSILCDEKSDGFRIINFEMFKEKQQRAGPRLQVKQNVHRL